MDLSLLTFSTRRLIIASLGAALFGPTAAMAQDAPRSWQCVTFARFFSGINLFGDAWRWWDQAVGKYTRGQAPKTGAVLVFRPFDHMKHGHVAVVTQVVTDRIIQITHANWSPLNGHRGKVEENVTVVDVSQTGDWTKVKVWYDPTHDMGSKTYPTFGFVYQNDAKGGADRNLAASDPASGPTLDDLITASDAPQKPGKQ